MIVTGVIIATTGFTRADSIASIAVGLLILPRTWQLLRETIDVLLEASPRGMDLSEVRRHMTDLSGVRDVHELHAWTITSGTKAPQAAAVIHKDFERGFIACETIAYDDYVVHNGEAGAREAGKLRIEGKEYVVKDGDVLLFRFNV